MKGDFSRFTHEPSKHYTGVLKQQGRVDLDADWNEYVEIQNHLRRAMETDLMGGTGVPDKAGGFYISWDTSNQQLIVSADDSADPSRPSRIYVDSILCELESTQVPFEKTDDNLVRVQDLVVDGRRFEEGQWVELIAEESADTELVQIEDVNPATKELTLSSDVEDNFTHLRRITTYSSQPHYPEPEALSPQDGRFDLVYLDVWQRHVTAIEDPDIREEALVGPDTTTRLQTVWQVKVRNIPNLNSLPETCSPDALPDDWPPAELGGGQLSTGGSYRGSENRLYRVEIHDSGTAGDGSATFKWSRDNGTVVFPIIPIDEATRTPQKDKVRVSRLGRDQTLALRGGDWVEVGGDESELNGEPGLIAKIEKDGIDRTRLELTLESDDVTPFAGERHPKVRRWDQTEAGNGTFDPEKGACKVEEGKWIELEDGVQIWFEPGNPDHVYRRGDYWIFAVRAATSRVEELAKAPPRGVRHHYCPLALVRWGGRAGSITAEIRDCRTRFGSLSGQLATVESFFYLGGDGQEALPGKEVLQALRVGLTKGGQPLDDRQIRFTTERGNGRLRKVDGTYVAPNDPVTVTTQGGVAECAWALDTEMQVQQVRATVVDGNQAWIIFTANLSGWSVFGNRDIDVNNNFLGTIDNQPLDIRTNNTLRMRLAAGGNVGIGIDRRAEPLYKLHVVAPGGFGGEDFQGVARAGNVPLVAQSNSTAIGVINGDRRQAFALNIDSNEGTNNTRGVPTFYDKYDGAWHQCISLKNGNVGIGTAAPAAKLQVSGGAIMPAIGNSQSAGIQFPRDPGGGAGDEAFIRYFVEGGETTKLLIGCQNDADDRISLYQFGGERLTIYNGNVGIGTTSPGAKLDVSGSGGATQCCAPVAPTLSLAEASNTANRGAWLQFHNVNEAEAYIRLAGTGPAGSYREGRRRLELGDNQGVGTGLRIVASAPSSSPSSYSFLSLPKTTDGYAELTNWRGLGSHPFFSDNPVGTLRLGMAPHQPLGAPVPTYTFAVGHPGTFHVGWPFNITYDAFATKFSVNQAGNVFVAGDLQVGGLLRAPRKEGYVVDNFINGVGDTLEQGDVIVIGSSDSSYYSGRNNSIPLIEGDLTDIAYDSRVCGIVDDVVTENQLPHVDERQAPSLEDVAREVNATEGAVKKAVELGLNPFELEGREGTGSGGRVLVADVETAAEERGSSSMSGAEGLKTYLNPLVKFAGEILPKSDATKIEDQQMGRMVTLGAFAHCKVDADIAPISAGDLLTTSPTKGHAQKVLEPEKAAGAIVGKALASLDRGKGKIPVLVMLQ